MEALGSFSGENFLLQLDGVVFVTSREHPRQHRAGSHAAAAGVPAKGSVGTGPCPVSALLSWVVETSSSSLRTPGPGLSPTQRCGSIFQPQGYNRFHSNPDTFFPSEDKKDIFLLTHLKCACMPPFPCAPTLPHFSAS